MPGKKSSDAREKITFVQSEHDLPYADYVFGTTDGTGENVNDTIRYYTEQLGPIAHMRQVHGDRIAYADKVGVYEEVDALYTDKPDLWLAVKTADCVPVLVSSPKAVAAVHCGWRGLHAQLLPKTLQTMMETFGVSPMELYVHTGPCIRAEHYEVDDTFAHYFDERFLKPAKKKGKLLLNMPAVVRRQAMDAGINDLNIFDSALCTYEDDDLFHSYRRAKHAGQENYRVQLSLICRDVEE